MRLYTKTGDDGTTGLFGGERVLKHHLRVEAYGHVDELNACLGWTRCAGMKSGDGEKAWERLGEILTQLQSRLFDLGADLATPSGSKHENKVMRLTAEHVAEAERWIDEVDAANSPITTFVLPGGTELASRLHVARTVCRRAERAMVHLQQSETVNGHAIVYINRISDLLFALARRVNKEQGVADIPWIPA